MILNDGTDTRTEWRQPGPYCDGMAVVLDRLAGVSGEDESAGDVQFSGWFGRFGRRILEVDSMGFMGTHTFATVAEAEAVIAEIGAEYDDAE